MGNSKFAGWVGAGLLVIACGAWANEPGAEKGDPLIERQQKAPLKKFRAWSVSSLAGEYRLVQNQPSCPLQIQITYDEKTLKASLVERNDEKGWPEPKWVFDQIDQDQKIIEAPETQTLTRSWTHGARLSLEILGAEERRLISLEQRKAAGRTEVVYTETVYRNEKPEAAREACVYEKIELTSEVPEAPAKK